MFDFNDLYQLTDYEAFAKLFDPTRISSPAKNLERLVKQIMLETERLGKDKNSATYIRRGGALMGMGLFECATEDFNEAIKLNPDSLCAYFSRAAAYTLLNKQDLAKEDYLNWYNKLCKTMPYSPANPFMVNPFAMINATHAAQEWAEVCSSWLSDYLNSV